jgi:protein tyrosine/serine phosphatase
MMNRFPFLFVLVSTIFAAKILFAQQPPPAAMPSAYAQKIHIDGVNNAGKIGDHLYRGAQPQPTAFAEMKKLGISTDVDLREDSKVVGAERREAEAAGLHFVNIPVGAFSSPTNAQIVQFLSIFRDHPEETVFVHCKYGDDRTGVFVASYRMAMQHWPAEQARHEMDFFGFHKTVEHEMAEYVRDFPARLNTAPELVEFLRTLTSPAESPAVK